MPDLSQRVREINSAKTTTRKVTVEKKPARRGRPPKKVTPPTTKVRQAKPKTTTKVTATPEKANVMPPFIIDVKEPIPDDKMLVNKTLWFIGLGCDIAILICQLILIFGR